MGNPQFATHLLPVRFTEESQEVYGLASFWLETLFHLAGEFAADHPEFVRELSEPHNALSLRWRDEGLEGIARAAVLDASTGTSIRLCVAAIASGGKWTIPIQDPVANNTPGHRDRLTARRRGRRFPFAVTRGLPSSPALRRPRPATAPSGRHRGSGPRTHSPPPAASTAHA